jgi:hypothetical protein
VWPPREDRVYHPCWGGPGAHAFCGCVPPWRAYRPFDKSREEVGTRFLGWLQDELGSLLSIVTGLISYASLMTYEGAVNALSCEGCSHFEAFDRVNKDFDAGVF